MKTHSQHVDCVHHWIIDDPHGVYSFGRCTRCGLVKRFINNWDEILAASKKEVSTANVE